jgi:hypothetical protein
LIFRGIIQISERVLRKAEDLEKTCAKPGLFFCRETHVKLKPESVYSRNRTLVAEAKIRYYKDVSLCENYVQDFFIAAILPVSVKFNAISL